MHIVLLNGPAGAGKNTFAEALRASLFATMRDARVKPWHSDGQYRVLIQEYKQPIIDMLFSFAESLSIVEIGADKADPDLYRLLKETDLLGINGRQLMIDWSEAMKKRVPDIWVDFALTKARNIGVDVLIMADCGFENEVAVPVKRMGHRSVDLIYFDGWQAHPPVYKHGDQFPGDSRFCLRGYETMPSDPTPEQAANHIVTAIVGNGKQSALEF